MAELNLRVCEELHTRIMNACILHGLNITEFCRKAVRQFKSGKIEPVVEHELLQSTTYGGGVIQSWTWEFDISGKELTAILISALVKLENAKAPKLPEIEPIEGLDYNIPESELLAPVKQDIAILKRDFYNGKLGIPFDPKGRCNNGK